MINILSILLSGLSQSQYYSWSILTSILDALIVGLAIGIASLIIRITVIHRVNHKNVESNTYKLISTLINLADSFHDQLSFKNIKSHEKYLLQIAKNKVHSSTLYANLPKDLANVIHKHVIYLLMKPIYKTLSSSALFVETHKINWNKFKCMSAHDYCLIYSKYPKSREKYTKSHPSFQVCYNVYEELKGDMQQ